MDEANDLKAALEVVGVLLIPIVLLLESWLDEALKCANTTVSNVEEQRDEVRTNAVRLWPRTLTLLLFCSALAVMLTRPAFGLQWAGWQTYDLISTAYGLMTTTLWLGAAGLLVLTFRLINKWLEAQPQ